MNLVFAGLLVLLSFLLVKKTLRLASKKTTADERTELISLKTSQAVLLILTTTLAISSFLLIYLGQYGTIPSNYIYYLGVITSYLTGLILVLYLILYAFFNSQS